MYHQYHFSHEKNPIFQQGVCHEYGVSNEEISEHGKILGCSSFGCFLERISYRFPFLERLSVETKGLSEEEDKHFSNIHVFKDFLYLFSLKLRFMRTKSLKITSYLPKLNELDIFRYCKESEAVLGQPAPNLTIEWDKIPCLNVLKLYNWSLSNEIRYPDDHIFENITLGSTKTLCGILHLVNIKSLHIKDESLMFMKRLPPSKNLNQLRKLTLSLGRSFRNVITSSISEVKDLQNLEEVFLVGCGSFDNLWRLENKNGILLENLAKLRKVKLDGLYFNVLLSNTPNIEILDCEIFGGEGEVEFKNGRDSANLRILRVIESENDGIGPILKENVMSVKNLDKLERLEVDCFGYIEISVVGWKKLEEFLLSGETKVKEIRDCPCLEEISYFETSSDFQILHDSLPKLRRLSFSTNSFFPFFENLNGRALDKLEISSNGKEDLHLSPRNISGIKYLDLCKASELIIHGVRNIPTFLSKMCLTNVDHVDLCDLLILKDCRIWYSTVVIVKNCQKLKILKIWGSYYSNQSMSITDRIEICNLPSAKKIEIHTDSLIKNLIVSGIPNGMKCSTKMTQNKRKKEVVDDPDNVSLGSIHIMYKKE